MGFEKITPGFAPQFVIRDPYVFEFLGIKSKEVMGESHMEDALLDFAGVFMVMCPQPSAGNFLQQIGEAMQNSPKNEGQDSTQSNNASRILVHTDASTGQRSLNIPLPDDQTLNHLAQLLGKLFNNGK